MVRHLLDMGVPTQAAPTDSHFMSPLTAACAGSQEDVIDLLLERGADPNFTSNTLMAPISMAAAGGSLSIVRKLLDHGANVNESRNDFWHLPAIWYAFAREHTSMVRLLLARGASLKGEADENGMFEGWIGQTALEMVIGLGSESMADILREHGCELPRSPPSNSEPGPSWGTSGYADALVWRHNIHSRTNLTLSDTSTDWVRAILPDSYRRAIQVSQEQEMGFDEDTFDYSW